MVTVQERRRFKQLDREQSKYEATWQPRIEAAIDAQLAPFYAALIKNGPDYALAHINELIQSGPMNDVLGRLWRIVGTHAANSEWAYFQSIYGAEIRQEKRFGFNAIWSSILDNLFRTFGGERIVKIRSTELERVKRELQRYAQDRTLTNYELAERLRSTDIPKRRSRVIARTETATAASAGAHAAASKTGFLMRKIWLSTQDNRTRRLPEDKADHKVMNNQEVGMNDKFLVPAKGGFTLMDRPHDPTAPPWQTIQCRCKAVYRAARDAAGRLIRIGNGNTSRPQ